MKAISFIGVGVMGGPMGINLINAGFDLSVYTRTKSKAHRVISAGAKWCGTISDCVSCADVVITMVGSPDEVYQVYFGQGGIIECAKEGAYLIDMTTTSPKLSKEIYAAAKKRGLRALDAPVTGGDVGAINASLSIMVGGDKDAFDDCMPVFEAVGKTIVYQGGPGCGQNTKMANQIAIAGTVASVCEAISYIKAAGLDPKLALSCLGMGAASSFQLEHTAPKILNEDYSPSFYIRHFIKDMKIAAAEARDANLTLNVLNDVLAMYESLAQDGMGELGTQALIKYYESSSQK